MGDSPGTRREFVKKAAYVAPAILTLATSPAFAKSGSEKGDEDGPDEGGNNAGTTHRPKLPGFRSGDD